VEWIGGPSACPESGKPEVGTLGRTRINNQYHGRACPDHPAIRGLRGHRGVDRGTLGLPGINQARAWHLGEDSELTQPMSWSGLSRPSSHPRTPKPSLTGSGDPRPPRNQPSPRNIPWGRTRHSTQPMSWSGLSRPSSHPRPPEPGRKLDPRGPRPARRMITGAGVVHNLSFERPRPERWQARRAGVLPAKAVGTDCQSSTGKIPDSRGTAAASGNASGGECVR
jgi:hypothetical protein